MRRVLSVAVLVFASLAAQAAMVVGSAQAEEFSALEVEYAEALVEWEVAYAAARDAGVRSRERPAKPAAAFWLRYMQTLEGGSGPAALWLVEHLRDADLKGRERKQVLPLIVERAFAPELAQEPWLPEFCLVLAKRRGDLDHGATLAALDSWLAFGLQPEARAAGLWLKAEVLSWDRKHLEQNTPLMAEALQAALELAPHSEAGRRAGSEVFGVLRAEFSSSLDAEGDGAVQLDMSAWRARFEQLASAGVEDAEVWLDGTSWVNEPDADYDRLLELELEVEEVWLGRVKAASAEAELAEEGAVKVSMPSRRLMALYDQPPETGFWPAFEALADSDPRAGAWLVQNGSQMPNRSEASRDRLFARLEVLVREHGDAEWAPELAESLARGVPGLLGEERVEGLIAGWADATSNEEVEVQLRYQLAIAEAKRDKQRGVALFRELAERWPEHDIGERALGRIASLTQLSTGQVAPDIAGADLDGVKFKLSDYRGKVVMLDFWGDW